MLSTSATTIKYCTKVLRTPLFSNHPFNGLRASLRPWTGPVSSHRRGLMCRRSHGLLALPLSSLGLHQLQRLHSVAARRWAIKVDVDLGLSSSPPSVDTASIAASSVRALRCWLPLDQTRKGSVGALSAARHAFLPRSP